MGTEERKEYNRVIEEIRKNGLFLFLKVLFFLEDILSRDEDGGLKVAQDSVCKCLGIDDRYVMDAHIGKRPANGRERCEISVYLWQEDAA